MHLMVGTRPHASTCCLLVYYNSTLYTPHTHPYLMHPGGSGPGVLRLRVHPARRGGAAGVRGAGRVVHAVYGGY